MTTWQSLYIPGPDEQGDYVTGSGCSLTRAEAQAYYNVCREEGALIYALVSQRGVWAATMNPGDKPPRDIGNWKA